MKLKITICFVIIFYFSNAVATEKEELFVFIGEKMSIEQIELPPPDNPRLRRVDLAFDAKYRIIKTLIGNLPDDYVNFRVFDHLGTLKFSKFNHVMLFLTKHENRFYHVKYQFFDVYKTVTGKWAYCGQSYGLNGDPQSAFPEKITATEIKFKDAISYNISNLIKNSLDEFGTKNDAALEIEHHYPNEFFEISGAHAICRGKGIYANDLARAHSKFLANAPR